LGHHQKNIKKATMIVISSAIKKNNKELVFSKMKILKNLVIKQKYFLKSFIGKML